MSKFRIIPAITFNSVSVVKSIGFKQPRIVGDLPSVIRVFSRRQADELILLNVNQQKQNENRESMMEAVVKNANMPLTVGGGVNSLDDASFFIQNGADKISVNSLLYSDKEVVTKIIEKFGTQVLVAYVDFRYSNGIFKFFSNFGNRLENVPDVNTHIRNLIDIGVGEIVLNDMEREGTLLGLNLDAINAINTAVKVPLIYSGGLKSARDFQELFKRGFSGGSAGSLFFWQGDSTISLKKQLLALDVNVRTVL